MSSSTSSPERRRGRSSPTSRRIRQPRASRVRRRRLVSVGRVGRAHGLDGSFYVVGADPDALKPGVEVRIADAVRRVERRAGTNQRPIVRLSGVGSREQARSLQGQHLLVEQELAADEWLAGELEGLSVVTDRGRPLGRVARVLEAPSVSLLELDQGTLVPLVRDALIAVDLESGRITVSAAFLGLADDEE